MTTHAPLHVKPKTTEEFALDHHSILTTIILASLLTVSLAAFLVIFCKKEKLCCFNPGRRSRFTLIDLISSPVDPPLKPSTTSLIFNFTKKFEKEHVVKNRGTDV
ncbi:hypothetical protein BgiMline_013427 [Biomphalaria glabrata]|uniref:Uncharacterized protein LOC106053651 n=1 Tax=Biomphalaria glabrata TaxID=6526 RepID=A0A2C9LGJ3_BIOGL|nr:uncharacterized protein LOC106053651 [Biomphalaria glabrata]KAI8750281.1 hypothetical protein BgiMline_017231 [Biomphalaria glabrata]KAI8787561.1 hypothetical protein BgiBS90_012699 [Biomphalaria glabrata]